MQVCTYTILHIISVLTPLFSTDPPRVSNITEGGCLVEWSAVKMASAQSGEIHYKVQVTRGRETESKMVYTGSDLQWRVNGLESRCDFTLRVAAVRVPPASARADDEKTSSSGSPRKQLELTGAWSPPCVFTTLDGGVGGSAAATGGSGGGVTATQATGEGSRVMAGFLPTVRRGQLMLAHGGYRVHDLFFFQGGPKSWSDTQRAYFIVVGFSVFALLVAFAVERIMAWAP